MLTPQIEGTAAIQSSAREFAEAFKQRVAAGLLAGRPHPRSNYRVVEASRDRVRVHAADGGVIALHMRPLHRLVTRIIGEVDARLTSRGATP